MLNTDEEVIEQFRKYLTQIAVKKKGNGHYTQGVARDYIFAVNCIGSNLNQNLWKETDGTRIRSIIEKARNYEWFLERDTHGRLSSGIKRYSEFLDYIS